jgi:integrase
MGKPKSQAPPPPPVSGAHDWEREDWLPATGIDWLETLRAGHLALVHEFRLAVARCGELEAEAEDAARQWRRAVRDAVASGEPPPERDFDPAIQRAQREVAEEDLSAARSELARYAVDSLQACRVHRRELLGMPVSAGLARSLGAGVEGSLEGVAEDLRRKLASLETAKSSGGVVDVTDPSNASLVESEEREAAKAADVNDLIAAMEKGSKPGARRKGDRRYGKPVGTKSIRNYIGTLSALLNFAMRKGWLAANVARLVDLPANARSEAIHFLTVEEVNALVGAAQPGEYAALDRALYLTAAMTGLRQGELVALRWCDVDWQAGKVRVRRNFVLGEFGTPKSKRSSRAVPLADAVAGELDRLFKASGRQGEDDLVFADPITGGPLDKAAILRRYRKALKVATLDEAHRFHDLRHTFGTRMAAAGVPMRTLQEWMGHRDIETTQRYADYAPSPHEADLVNRAFAYEPTPVIGAAA